MLNQVMELIFITIFCTLIITKLRIIKNMSFLKKAMINIGILLLMAITNPILMALYLGFFLVTETLYFIFENLSYNIKKGDRIVISSIVSTVVTAILMVFFKDMIGEYISSAILEIKDRMSNLSPSSQEYIYYKSVLQNMLQSIKIIKNHWLTNIFSTSILCTFGIYIALEKKKNEIWELSFEWLLVYIIPFFILNLTNIKNHYLEEISEIGLGIFSLYGVAVVFNLLNKYTKMKYISAILAIYMLLYSNVTALAIGVVISFMPELLIKIKKDN